MAEQQKNEQPKQPKEAPKDQSAELQKATTDAQRESGGRPHPDEDVILIGAGQKASFPKADESGSIVMEKEVIAEVRVENALQPSHVLVFAKGQTVTQAQLDAAAATYGAAGEG